MRYLGFPPSLTTPFSVAHTFPTHDKRKSDNHTLPGLRQRRKNEEIARRKKKKENSLRERVCHGVSFPATHTPALSGMQRQGRQRGGWVRERPKERGKKGRGESVDFCVSFFACGDPGGEGGGASRWLHGGWGPPNSSAFESCPELFEEKKKKIKRNKGESEIRREKERTSQTGLHGKLGCHREQR